MVPITGTFGVTQWMKNQKEPSAGKEATRGHGKAVESEISVGLGKCAVL